MVTSKSQKANAVFKFVTPAKMEEGTFKMSKTDISSLTDLVTFEVNNFKVKHGGTLYYNLKLKKFERNQNSKSAISVAQNSIILAYKKELNKQLKMYFPFVSESSVKMWVECEVYNTQESFFIYKEVTLSFKIDSVDWKF